MTAHDGAMTIRCKSCAVRDRAVCAALDDRALAELSGIGRVRHLARGETLAWEGDEALACANLISGVIKLGASTADGREQTVELLYPADVVGRPYADETGFTATALTDAELCLFPRRGFERMIEAHPAMERILLARTLAALDDARRRMLTLGRRSAAERVAGMLIEMEGRLDARGRPFELPLTRGEMAEVLGLTIETVSRQLTRLTRAGTIALSGARGVAILDRRALEAETG